MIVYHPSLLSADSGSAPPPPPKRPRGEGEAADGARRLPLVLLIDDSPQDHELISAAFEDRLEGSVALHWVQSVREALAYLEGRPPYDRRVHPAPDLVLLDLQLPGEDGFELLRTFRRRPDDAAPAVVVLTTSTDELDRRKAAELGAHEYLVKPTGFRELCMLVERTAKRFLNRD